MSAKIFLWAIFLLNFYLRGFFAHSTDEFVVKTVPIDLQTPKEDIQSLLDDVNGKVSVIEKSNGTSFNISPTTAVSKSFLIDAKL